MIFYLGFSPIAQVENGLFHVCTLENENVNCAGWNYFGQANAPKDLDNIKMIAAGTAHTCALTHAGLLTCWGSEEYGEATIPNDLYLPENKVHTVAAGGRSTCVIYGDKKRVRCWGLIKKWDLKDFQGSDTLRVHNRFLCAKSGTLLECSFFPPKNIDGLFAVGYEYHCAVISGQIECFHEHMEDHHPILSPPLVVGVVRQLSAGTHHACVLDDEGVKCWGSNYYGQIEVPAGLKGTHSISAGEGSTCAASKNETICWGQISDDGFEKEENILNIMK